MIDIDIFAIKVELDELEEADKEWFFSFEEAMENRMKYANCLSPQGDVWIARYHGGPNVVEEWHVDKDGNIVNHYDWRHI